MPRRAPRFEGAALVVLGHVGIQLRRARVFVAQCPLHDMERMSVLDHLCAACVAQLMDRVARLPVGVEQLRLGAQPPQ